LATALVFAMQAPANADLYNVNGNQLLTMCVEKNDLTQGICIGYVMGIADVYLASFIAESLRICMSSEVTRKQIVDVTVAFLQSHPEQRHFIAVGLVWDALHTAFPCKSN
jgi:Rap1a immunity proteins